MDEVAALAEFDTSALSGAVDRLGIVGQAQGFFPLNESFGLTGRGFTGSYQPVDGSGGTVGDYRRRCTRYVISSGQCWPDRCDGVGTSSLWSPPAATEPGPLSTGYVVTAVGRAS